MVPIAMFLFLMGLQAKAPVSELVPVPHADWIKSGRATSDTLLVVVECGNRPDKPVWCDPPVKPKDNSHIESAHDEHEKREIRVMPVVFPH